MKRKNLNLTFSILSATLTLVLFNNFESVNWNLKGVSIEKVNEASRISHAKELLGPNYKGSLVQKLEGKKSTKSLNYNIYQKVQSQLSAPWKGKALDIAHTVIKESTKYGFDPVFVLAVIKTESQFNPMTLGGHGEIGLMQLKPDTAEWIAKKYDIAWKGPKTLENPSSNIRLGLAYMDYLRSQFKGAPRNYVSAYNMGPKNVRRLAAQEIKPTEYSLRVMNNYFELYSLISATNTTVAAN
jgi:soluble lytic murein transglycosylase